MTRETIEQKALRYLGAGKVTITTVNSRWVVAEVEGGEKYRTRWHRGQWSCNCPARTRRCCHVLAIQRVTNPEGEQ